MDLYCNKQSIKENINSKMTRIEKITRRFFNFVDKNLQAPCWIWTGARSGGRLPHQRYGVFRPTWFTNDRKMEYSHRTSYILHHGLLLPNDEVLHTCDVPLCVNPDHLFKGTQQENVDDMVMKDRHTRGSRNGVAILTEENIVKIKMLRSKGLLHREIAVMFGVCRATISMILEGKNWKHVQNTAITRASEKILIQR